MLILGSFPGELSLAHEQYYAHPRNGFWPIIGMLFDFDPRDSYERRIRKLYENRIALWDVLSSCRRKGSLDTSIEKESVRINDFQVFFDDNPHIQYVFFNGRRAEAEFKRHVLSIESVASRNLELRCLPSSSPAMAALTLEQKTAVWRSIADILFNH